MRMHVLQAENEGEAALSIIEVDKWELLKQYHGSYNTPDLGVTFKLEDAPPGTATQPQPPADAHPQAAPHRASSPVEIGDSPASAVLV